MRYWLGLAPVLLVFGLGFPGATAAQSVRDDTGPAEFPPASYTADQYVDSRGCVYIRVGYGGTTDWVPRVNRSRQVLCGYRPSLPSAQTATATEPGPAPATEAPVVISGPGAAPATRPDEPMAGTVRTTTDAGTTTTRPRTATTVIRTAPAAQPAAAQVTVAPAPAAASPAAPPAGRQPRCVWQTVNGRTTLYSEYDNVRCGPQPNHPGPGASEAGAAAGGAVVPISVPEGYRPAWDDGRLNPQRGPRTVTGDEQMALVWSDTVPRRLIRGQVAPDAPGGAVYSTPVVDNSDPAALVVTTSTRGQAAPRTPAVAPGAAPAGLTADPGHRFVQIGRYDSRDAARAARDRLARGGLGASIGRSQRGGQMSFLVLAGPYDDARALDRALALARGAGFGGAITRR